MIKVLKIVALVCSALGVLSWVPLFVFRLPTPLGMFSFPLGVIALVCAVILAKHKEPLWKKAVRFALAVFNIAIAVVMFGGIDFLWHFLPQ